jgi:hypothetical protein
LLAGVFIGEEVPDMKRISATIGAAAMLLLTTGGLSAQGRDFAGRWTIDTERMAAAAGASSGGAGGMRSGGGGGGGGMVAGASGGGGGGTGGMRTGGGGGRGGGTMVATGSTTPPPVGATGSPASLSFEMSATAVTLSNGTTETAYHLDGSSLAFTTVRGDATAKASWKADHFVIETTINGAAGPIVTTSAWYLDDQGLVNDSSTKTADGQSTSRKTFYKKKS